MTSSGVWRRVHRRRLTHGKSGESRIARRSTTQLVVLASIGLAAFFIASGVERLLAVPVVGDRDDAASLVLEFPDPVRTARTPGGAAVIIARNPFESTKADGGAGGVGCWPPAYPIVRISASEFTVERSVLDWLLEGYREHLSRHSRFVAARGASAGGLRMLAVRGTLLEKLGFQDDDRLERINGLALSSPEEALGAYARLRGATHLTAQGVRQGQPMTIEFRMR